MSKSKLTEILEKKCWPGYRRVPGKVSGQPGSCKKIGEDDDEKEDVIDAEDAGLDEKSKPRIPRKPGQPASSKKHSDLYTDENPKGTIHGLGFKDVATAKASVSKIRGSSRSHAHKIQAAVAMEQRAREMGKSSEAAIFRDFIDTMKKKTQSMKEGSDKGGLRGWFKDGGWDRYDSKGNKIGKCGGRKPGEAKPKCFSKEKAAALGKKGRAAAVRRKRREDPNPEGTGKPINTPSTKKGLKMRKEVKESFYNRIANLIIESEGKKDACYHKVKASAAKWPSAYASGRLVQCRKKGAANYGNSKNEEDVDEKKGTMPKMKMGVHKSRSGGLTAKGVAAYRAKNPGSKLKTAVTTKPSKLKKGSKAANRRKSFCARMGGMKKRLTSKKTANDPNSRINKALRKWNC